MLRESYSARTWSSRGSNKPFCRLPNVGNNSATSINGRGYGGGRSPAVTSRLRAPHSTVTALPDDSRSDVNHTNLAGTRKIGISCDGSHGVVHVDNRGAIAEVPPIPSREAAPTVECSGSYNFQQHQSQGWQKHHVSASALGGSSSDARMRHIPGPGSSTCTTSVGGGVAARAGLFGSLGGGLRRHVACSAVGAVAGTAAVVAALYRSAAAVITASGTAAVAVGALGGAVVGEVLLATARDEDVETDRDVERGMEEAAEKVIAKLRAAKAKGRLRRHGGAQHRRDPAAVAASTAAATTASGHNDSSRSGGVA